MKANIYKGCLVPRGVKMCPHLPVDIDTCLMSHLWYEKRRRGNVLLHSEAFVRG